MALSKEDRITMSKKIVTIPDDNAVVEVIKKQVLAQQKIAIENDNVNAALQEPYNQKINSYQPEYNLIDGKKRTILTENLINAAAKGENRNGFFLADPEFPIPSVPDGVWKFFAPMSFCYAIGKKNNEQYDAEPLGEIQTLNRIKPILKQIEGFIDATRASGKKCSQEGVCQGGSGSTQQECLSNGGTWTLQDVIVDSPEIQSKLNDLKSEIQTWTNSLNGQKSNIQISDLDVAARQAENQAAYDYIGPLLVGLYGCINPYSSLGYRCHLQRYSDSKLCSQRYTGFAFSPLVTNNFLYHRRNYCLCHRNILGYYGNISTIGYPALISATNYGYNRFFSYCQWYFS